MTKYRVMIKENDGSIMYSARWLDTNPLVEISELRAQLAEATKTMLHHKEVADTYFAELVKHGWGTPEGAAPPAAPHNVCAACGKAIIDEEGRMFPEKPAAPHFLTDEATIEMLAEDAEKAAPAPRTETERVMKNLSTMLIEKPAARKTGLLGDQKAFPYKKPPAAPAPLCEKCGGEGVIDDHSDPVLVFGQKCDVCNGTGRAPAAPNPGKSLSIAGTGPGTARRGARAFEGETDGKAAAGDDPVCDICGKPRSHHDSHGVYNTCETFKPEEGEFCECGHPKGELLPQVRGWLGM